MAKITENIKSLRITCARAGHTFCRIGLDPLINRREANCIKCVNRDAHNHDCNMAVLEHHNGEVWTSFDDGNRWTLVEEGYRDVYIYSPDDEFLTNCNLLPRVIMGTDNG